MRIKSLLGCVRLVAAIALLAANESSTILAYIAPYVSQQDFSGVVYIAGRHGDIYRGAFGNVASFDTSFAIGSVSKTFTAAAVELLAARGKLRYADRLDTLVPEYSHSKDITIDELLKHSAGVPDFYSIPAFAAVREQNLSLAQIVRWLNTYPLDFKPGTKGNYSNSGYLLLALAIERASGNSYAKFLHDNIFVPMDLKHTSAEAVDPHENAAAGYDPGPPPRGLVAPAEIAPGWFVGNGSIRSNAADLSRWLGIAAAFPHPAGWGKRTVGANTILEQDGRIPGFASDISIDEQTGLKVIVLSNIQCAAATTIARDLRKLAGGGTVATPALRSRYAPAPDALAAVVGTYGFRGLPLVVSRKGDDVFLSNANDGMQLVLDPVGPNAFFFRPLYVSVRFKTDAKGVVQSIDWDGQFTIPRTN
ncbi:MAG: serine hydrolase domain-containing protein [Candidatus Cybelea sp.]